MGGSGLSDISTNLVEYYLDISTNCKFTLKTLEFTLARCKSNCFCFSCRIAGAMGKSYRKGKERKYLGDGENMGSKRRIIFYRMGTGGRGREGEGKGKV